MINTCFQYALTVALDYQNIKKEYQKLNLLLISIIRKTQAFHRTKKITKSLN